MAKRRAATVCGEPGCETKIKQSNRSGFCIVHAGRLREDPVCAHPGCARTYEVKHGVCPFHRHMEGCSCQFCSDPDSRGFRVQTKELVSLSPTSGSRDGLVRVTMIAAPWEIAS